MLKVKYKLFDDCLFIKAKLVIEISFQKFLNG
jgi:hypothetical protein